MTTQPQLTPRTLHPMADGRAITDTVNQLIKASPISGVTVNVKQFGAKGDGATDDLAAFTAAIAYIKLYGGVLYVPASINVYKCSAPIVAADFSFVLYGDGDDVSVISFTGATGGVQWSSSSTADTFHIKNLKINAGATLAGPAISSSFSGSTGPVQVSYLVSDVMISDSGGGSWAAGIYLNNCRNASIIATNFDGTYGTTTYGFKLDGNSTDVRMVQCECSDMAKAIYKSGTCEGLSVHQFLAINVDVGIYSDHAAGEPGLYVTDSHFNVNTKCFDLTNIMQAYIANCLLYGYTGGAMAGLVQFALAGSDSADINIINSHFHGDGYTGSKEGISLSTGARVNVSHCIFSSLTTAVTFGASSSDCFAGFNRYNSVTTHITNSGTNNKSINFDQTYLTNITQPGDPLVRFTGTSSSSLQLTDAGGAADTKTIGWFADAQTMLARLWNDDNTQKTDLARFAVGRVSIGGTLNSEALATNTGVFANRVAVTGVATTNPPTVTADGSDTNIDLSLAGKGTGLVRFGTHSAAGAEAFSGFITIKDAGGTSRKVMVCS